MSVELKNVTDSTQLHFLAYYGNLEVTKALAKKGAPLTMLIRTVKLHCIWLLTMAKQKTLVTSQKQVLTLIFVMHDRYTANHRAAVSGGVEIFKNLLDKETSVDLKNANDSTPLHFSASKGNLEAQKSLVKRGTPFKQR
jgi:ankyrin repeat protein